MSLINTTLVFLELVKAGLWENSPVHAEGLIVNGFSNIEWEDVYRLADEQSVVGLVLAGLEKTSTNRANNTNRPSQELLLQWIGEVQMLEQQNKTMNQFIGELIERLRKADIYTLLLKGQGIAQCYERPLWRACGDVDLLLSTDNYEKAKMFLTPLASHVEQEELKKKHLGMTMEDFVVELHGTVHVEFSDRVNRGIDEAQDDCFYGGNVRSWNNNGTTVFVPSPNNDVILVFTHILEHFFIEGVGLRQVCDWCRLLYRYRDELDLQFLESRIRRMGLMSEWRSFASLAVESLGMPKEAMPMYDSRYKVKGERVFERILKSGNMGHNNDLSYRAKYSGMTYKLVALWRRIKDFAGFTKIFPIDALKFFLNYVVRKV